MRESTKSSIVMGKTPVHTGRHLIFHTPWVSLFLFAYIAIGVTALILETPLIMVAITATMGLVYLVIKDLSYLYYLLAFVLPFSAEVMVTQTIGTDFPTELLLLLLLAIAPLIWMSESQKTPLLYIRHPISIWIILHIVWISVSALFAENQAISFKFLAAKIWYIVPFYFLPLYVFNRDISKYTSFFICLLVGTLLAGSYVFVNHLGDGLTFTSRTNAGSPIFRNHVNYACLITLVLPLVWFLWKSSKNKKWIYICSGVVLIVFLYFTYARIAYLAIGASILGVLITKYRLTLLTATFSLIIASTSIGILLHKNTYLNFAPDYESAITQQRFERLLSATYKMQDISTVERFYRWVAGIEMIKERPVIGYGPGNFYNNYAKHTVLSFKTYVSDNPDKSGIHNYYLMSFVEQGVVGFLVLIVLIFSVLLYAERVFHQITEPAQRNLVITAIAVIYSVIAINTVNDMMEVVKVGSFFFLACSILVSFDLSSKRNIQE